MFAGTARHSSFRHPSKTKRASHLYRQRSNMPRREYVLSDSHLHIVYFLPTATQFSIPGQLINQSFQKSFRLAFATLLCVCSSIPISSFHKCCIPHASSSRSGGPSLVLYACPNKEVSIRLVFCYLLPINQPKQKSTFPENPSLFSRSAVFMHQPVDTDKKNP